MHAQLLPIILALTGALAAPQGTYPAAGAGSAANETAPATGGSETSPATGSSGSVFPAFDTTGQAAVPGAKTLKYCGDPSKYLLQFKEVSLVPLVPQP